MIHTYTTALARSEIYGLLARALSYPDAALTESLRDGSFVADMGAALSVLPGLPESIQQALADLRAGQHKVSADELARQYQVVFGPLYFDGQSPYETAYLEDQLFQKMQQLADIAGFYWAFGVEAAGIERPDFVATELEFMHFLAYREAWARDRGHAEGADLCWNGQRSFLRDHLGRWAPSFCTRLAHEGVPVYSALGALTASFIVGDAANLHVELRPLTVARVEPMLCEPEACGDCPLQPEDKEADHAIL